MVALFLILIGISFLCGIILGIANIVSGGKILGEKHSDSDFGDVNDHRMTGFGNDSRSFPGNDNRAYSDPYDNHWESSFDWKDEDNDGYDDRDDGFWNEREF